MDCPQLSPNFSENSQDLSEDLIIERCPLVAARYFTTGEVVLAEKPIISLPKLWPSGNSFSFPCLSCFGLVDSIMDEGCCSKCLWPVCCRDCEMNPAHADNECKIFAMEEILPDRRRYKNVQVLRCLLLKEKDSFKWDQIMSLRSPRKYFDEEMTRDLVKFIRHTCGLEEFDGKTIIEVANVIWLNGRTTLSDFDGREDDTVTHLYHEASRLKHSCRPNSSLKILNNGDLILTAPKAIKNGDEVTVSFQPLLVGTNQRRIELEKRYRIWCNCKLCADPTEFGTFFSGVKCSACKSGTRLPLLPLDKDSDWSCLSCGNITSAQVVAKLVEYVKSELTSVLQLATSEVLKIYKLKNCLNEYEKKILHPNHYLLFGLRNDLLVRCWNLMMSGGSEPYTNIVVRKTLANCLIKDGIKCLEIVDKFWPGKTSQRGRTLGCIFFGYYHLLLAQNISMKTTALGLVSSDSGNYIMPCGNGLYELFLVAYKILRAVPDVNGESCMADILQEVSMKNGWKFEIIQQE